MFIKTYRFVSITWYKTISVTKIALLIILHCKLLFSICGTACVPLHCETGLNPAPLIGSQTSYHDKAIFDHWNDIHVQGQGHIDF